jgi:5-methylcytosine-specific restriction endonuclease McrA
MTDARFKVRKQPMMTAFRGKIESGQNSIASTVPALTIPSVEVMSMAVQSLPETTKQCTVGDRGSFPAEEFSRVSCDRAKSVTYGSNHFSSKTGPKRCTRCRLDKSPKSFPKNKNNLSGLDSWCKACHSSRNKEHYRKNRAAVNVRSRNWRLKNPDRYEQRLAAMRLTPEQWAEKRRTNKTADRTKYQREYARQKALERDIERIRQGVRMRPIKKRVCPIFQAASAGCKPCKLIQTKAWAKRNAEKVATQRRDRSKAPKYQAANRNNRRTRRARMKGVFADLTTEQWREIKASYNQRCAYCHERKPLTQDHVIPISKGGPHSAWNIVPACRSCNSRKHNNLIIPDGWAAPDELLFAQIWAQ